MHIGFELPKPALAKRKTAFRVNLLKQIYLTVQVITS